MQGKMVLCISLRSLVWGLTVLAVSGCSAVTSQQAAAPQQVLYVHHDGRMLLNDRPVDPADVIIYPDGFGGERAALKMRVPLHPDYYRDTIVVEREHDRPVPDTAVD